MDFIKEHYSGSDYSNYGYIYQNICTDSLCLVTPLYGDSDDYIMGFRIDYGDLDSKDNFSYFAKHIYADFLEYNILIGEL